MAFEGTSLVMLNCVPLNSFGSFDGINRISGDLQSSPEFPCQLEEGVIVYHLGTATTKVADRNRCEKS